MPNDLYVRAMGESVSWAEGGEAVAREHRQESTYDPEYEAVVSRRLQSCAAMATAWATIAMASSYADETPTDEPSLGPVLNTEP